jgi:PAS domain S-box-containing protein
MPTAEFRADAAGEIALTLALGALGMITLGIAPYLLRQRQVILEQGATAEVQSARLETMALLHSFTDTSGDAIFAKDAEGRYLLFNREAARITGRAPEWVLGRTDADVFGGEQAQRMRMSDLRVIESGETFEYESEVTGLAGPRLYDTTKNPLRAADGKIAGVFGISRDITARRKADDDLRDALELVQAVGDSVLSHLAVLDTFGRVIHVNAAWEAALGDQCAAALSLPRCPMGRNYIEVLQADATPERAIACAGILGVLSGELPAYTRAGSCSR